MQLHKTPRVLVVGLSEPLPATPLIRTTVVVKGSEAIAAMRIFQFDLLFVGPDIPDISMWTLIERIRDARPDQRWVLIGGNTSKEEEVRARTLGVLCVYDKVPSEHHLLTLVDAMKNKKIS